MSGGPATVAIQEKIESCCGMGSYCTVESESVMDSCAKADEVEIVVLKVKETDAKLDIPVDGR